MCKKQKVKKKRSSVVAEYLTVGLYVGFTQNVLRKNSVGFRQYCFCWLREINFNTRKGKIGPKFITAQCTGIYPWSGEGNRGSFIYKFIISLQRSFRLWISFFF